jgi:hypothetical protein
VGDRAVQAERDSLPGQGKPGADHVVADADASRSLRCGRPTLTVISPGKIWHLSGGRGECGRVAPWRTRTLAPIGRCRAGPKGQQPVQSQADPNPRAPSRPKSQQRAECPKAGHFPGALGRHLARIDENR